MVFVWIGIGVICGILLVMGIVALVKEKRNESEGYRKEKEAITGILKMRLSIFGGSPGIGLFRFSAAPCFFREKIVKKTL